MMKDLEVNKSTIECPYTVSYLGALFKEGEILICMELCDMSLDNYYKKAHQYELCVLDFVLEFLKHPWRMQFSKRYNFFTKKR